MLSRQYQQEKKKHLLLEGRLLLEVGTPGQDDFWFNGSRSTFHVKPKTVDSAHQFDVKLAEVSTPEIDDVVRIEDKYSNI